MNRTMKIGFAGFLIFTVFTWDCLFAGQEESILPDKILFQNDFSKTDVAGLVNRGGEWEISDGVYLQKKKIGVAETLIEGSYDNFSVQAKVMITGGSINKKVFFKFREAPSGFYEVYISNHEQAVGVAKNIDGKWLKLKTTATPIEMDRWYVLKAIINSSHLEVYLNGRLYVSIEDPSFSSGGVSIGTYEAEAEFDDIKVWSIKTEALFNAAIPSSARVWRQPGDFSDVQGRNNWYYLCSPKARLTGPFKEMDWDEGRHLWAQDPWSVISREGEKDMIFLSNSEEKAEDQILSWKSPVDGVVSVIGVAQNYSVGGEYAKSTDGYTIEIRKDDSPEARWKNFWDNTFWDIQPFMLNVPVKTGDFLYFRLASGKGHCHYDIGLINVTIVYPKISQ